MAKKNPGGQADTRRRGMKTVVIPLTPEVHALVQLAAGTFTGRDRAVTRFAAVALERAARNRLEEVGEAPKKNPKKPNAQP